MALTEEQILEAVIPEVEVSNITIESFEPSGTRFMVEYMVYDVVDNDEISRFFAQDQFQKYLKIRTQWSTNSRFGADRYNRNGRGSRNLKDIFTEENKLRERRIDSSRVIREFRFTETYTFETSPEHFEVFAISFIDTSQLEEDMSLEPNTFMLEPKDSAKTDHLVVLRDNKVSGTKISYMYDIDTEDRQNVRAEWRGEVHEMYGPNYRSGDKPESYMTGASHSESSFTVQRVEEPFRKIQDFRSKKVSSSVSIFDVYTNQETKEGFDSILAKSSGFERETILKLNEAARQSSSVSSDMWISRSISGDARFLLCFNLRELLINNSEFGAYYDNFSDELKDEILSNVEITSLLIKRKRVNKIRTSSGYRYEDFKDDEFGDEYVVETAMKSGATRISRVKTDKGSIKQIDLPVEPGLTFVTGTDYEMSDVTDGIYMYGYEIKILDPTRKFLRERVLACYPYITALHAVRTKILNSRGFYDRSIDGFSKGFIDEYTIDFSDKHYTKLLGYPDFEGRSVSYGEFIRQVVDKYRHSIRIFQNNQHYDTEFLRSLHTMSNESPKALDLLIEMFESLTNNLSEIAGLKNMGTDMFGEQRVNKSSVNEIYKSKYCTSQESIWDSNVPAGTGISYLEDPYLEFGELQSLTSDNDTIGLRTIQSGVWQARQSSEIRRFYGNNRSSVSIPLNETDDSGVAEFDLLGTGSQYLAPSIFVRDNVLMQNDISSAAACDTIMDSFLPVTSNYSQDRGNTPPPPSPGVPISGGGSGGVSSGWRSSMARNVFADFNVTFTDYEALSTDLNRTAQDEIEQLLETCIARAQPGRAIDPHAGADLENFEIPTVENVDPGGSVQETEDSQPRSFDLGTYVMRRFRPTFASSLNSSAIGFGPPAPPAPQRNMPDYDNAPAPSIPTAARFDMSTPSGRAASLLSGVSTRDSRSFVQSLPIQIKSLLYSSLEGTTTVDAFNIRPGVVNLELSGTYQVNTGFLASIEYFTGFQRRVYTGIPGLNSIDHVAGTKDLINFSRAEWKPLTQNAYQSFSGETLLCRIRQADFGELGIQSNDFGVPIYDSYFLINASASAAFAEGESVDASIRARRQAEAESEARRLHLETELEKARLIRHIEKLQREIEQLGESSAALEEQILRDETMIGVILSGPMNYRGDRTEYNFAESEDEETTILYDQEHLARIGPGQPRNVHGDRWLRDNMKPEPYREQKSLKSLNDSRHAAIRENARQVESREDLIIGFEAAIARATYVDIDTYDEVKRELEEHRDTVASAWNAARMIGEQILERERQINLVYSDRDNCRQYRVHVPPGLPSQARIHNKLNRRGEREVNEIEFQIHLLREQERTLTRNAAELERQIDDGEYLDRPLEDF